MADGNSNRDKQIRDKLLPHIQNAYAMENQLVEALEKHAKETADFPDIQAMIQQHLEQTKQHRDRMEQRINFYGYKPSAMKDLGSSLMGNMMGAMAGARPDQLARIARDEYISEHLEIAAYTLLITTARVFGDEETVRAAEMNRNDEINMQAWLLQHMPDACIRSLQQEGYQISSDAQQWAQQMNTAMSGSFVSGSSMSGSSMSSSGMSDTYAPGSSTYGSTMGDGSTSGMGNMGTTMDSSSMGDSAS